MIDQKRTKNLLSAGHGNRVRVRTPLRWRARPLFTGMKRTLNFFSYSILHSYPKLKLLNPPASRMGWKKIRHVSNPRIGRTIARINCIIALDIVILSGVLEYNMRFSPYILVHGMIPAGPARQSHLIQLEPDGLRSPLRASPRRVSRLAFLNR